MFVYAEYDGYVEILIGNLAFCANDVKYSMSYHTMSETFIENLYTNINSNVLDIYVLKAGYPMSSLYAMNKYIEVLRDKVRG